MFLLKLNLKHKIKIVLIRFLQDEVDCIKFYREKNQYYAWFDINFYILYVYRGLLDNRITATF